jgi:cellulose synthase/poly-beta-1,6-N-acetylglucosamine synthase-like glycosyltransferase
MTNAIQFLWQTIYLFALISLFIYGINCYFLMLCHRFNRPEAIRRHDKILDRFKRHALPVDWPTVTVQLPIFNERYVVERLIEAVCRLDYPKALLEIQVLDDSTDDTVDIARAMVEKMASSGVNIVHIRRRNRTGFKAGALKAGLERAKGELLAIFDADFLPEPNFLQETIPYFTDPEVGMVQSRWGHLNSDYSLLTRAQSIGIDGHFGVEQASRAWSGFFMNFNGTAGIWRKKAIEDAGGWQADTLTEDLDLSYRAQLRGWRLHFVPDIVCPAELPVTINAFKSQQHRWAKGSIQTARKHLGSLFARPDIPVMTKIQALLHLTHYMVHPMMLLVVLTSLPMLSTPWFFKELTWPLIIFTLLCLATFGPSTMYVFSQRLLYRDWPNRIKYLPFLMCLGTGIAVNNTGAILEALFNIKSGFIRTPKYGINRRDDGWKEKNYSIPFTSLSLLELFMGLYSLTSLILFVLFSKYLISPFLVIYTAGFFYVFSLSVRHGYGAARS